MSQTSPRGFLGIAGAAATVCTFVLCTGAQAQEDAKDWPMYNHDVIGSRCNSRGDIAQPGQCG